MDGREDLEIRYVATLIFLGVDMKMVIRTSKYVLILAQIVKEMMTKRTRWFMKQNAR